MPINFKNRQAITFGVVLLVALLIVVTLYLGRGTLRVGQNPFGAAPTPLPDQEKPQMMLSFIPNSITTSAGSTINANIQFDTYGNPAAGVVVVVSYDPEAVTNVKLTPYKDQTSALSYALTAGLQQKDEVKGTISQVFSLPNTTPQQKGHGIIAKFQAVLKSSNQTTIRIDTTSIAVSRGISHVPLGKVNLDINAR